MSVQAEFHSTLCRKYRALCISVRQPITEVKAEWNVAADVWEIDFYHANEVCGKFAADTPQVCRKHWVTKYRMSAANLLQTRRKLAADFKVH